VSLVFWPQIFSARKRGIGPFPVYETLRGEKDAPLIFRRRVRLYLGDVCPPAPWSDRERCDAARRRDHSGRVQMPDRRICL